MPDATGRLPNGDRAELDLRKLTEYCLNPGHPRGRHKARVFRDALGIGQADAEELRARFLRAAREGTAVLHERDEWGERWRVDVAMLRQNKRVMIRTIWIVRRSSPNPKFVTC
jgi:hypothetical protein